MRRKDQLQTVFSASSTKQSSILIQDWEDRNHSHENIRTEFYRHRELDIEGPSGWKGLPGSEDKKIWASEYRKPVAI